MGSPKSAIGGKRLAWLLTFLYCASYVTRINYAAALQAIITDTGLPKSGLAVIAVCLFVTYGLGQIVNGVIGDRIKPQKLLFCGLLISSIINLIFPFAEILLPRGAVVPVMSVLWSINGFAQAMMWPPIMKILVATMNETEFSYATVRVSWGSSFGTILVYLIAPLIVSLANWRWVFFACALFGAVATVLWGMLQSRVDYRPTKGVSQTDAERFPRGAVLPLILIGFAIVMMGMLRDGVTSWMPTYLAEVFRFDDAMSILCTVSLAVFSILSFSAASWLYRRFFKNEVVCAMAIFAVAILSALVMFLFFDVGAAVAIGCMSLITGCMHGINLMLITHVPKRFKRFGNVSTASGVINSFTYVGAAISTYGIAVLSEWIGWRNTVGVWAIIALLGGGACAFAASAWKKHMIHNGEASK